MGEDRIVKELDRLHESFVAFDGKLDRVDSKIDTVREEVYRQGTEQARYFERIDNLAHRVATVETEQKQGRRLLLTVLGTGLITLTVGVLQFLN